MIEQLNRLGIHDSLLRQLETTTREKGPQFLFSSLAMANIPIGALEESIRQQWPKTKPIRTGHSGGIWESIVLGGGEVVQFNEPLINGGLASPLIIDNTTTPATTTKIYQNSQTQGDFLYWPGTILTEQGITHLPLYIFEGQQYIPIDRQHPLFSPFVFTEADGQMVPIQTIHKNRNKELSLGQELVYFSDYLLQNWGKVDFITRALLEKISLIGNEKEQTELLNILFEKKVDIKGKRHDINLKMNNASVVIDLQEIPPADLLAQLKTLVEVMAGQKNLTDLASEFGNEYLCFGTDYLIFLAAVLGADRPNGNLEENDLFFSHYHWGGLMMAGAPPNIKGYMDSAVIGKIQKLASLLKDIEVPEIGKLKSIVFMLLPAAPYLLLPHADDLEECAAIERLIDSVLHKSLGKRGKKDQEEMVVKATQSWLTNERYNVSLHFANRFGSSPHNSIKHNYLQKGVGPFVKKYPPSAQVAIPKNFPELTTKEASIITGVIMRNGI